METVLEAAGRYRARGWHTIRLRPQEKMPAAPWANTPPAEAPDFLRGENIGIVLGEKSGGLVDLDFDWPEAAQIARVVFRHLPAFGRDSALQSHRVAICEAPERKTLFKLPNELPDVLVHPTAKEHQTVVLELRGSGHQTMFPPSVHPSGESVCWDSDFEDIPELDWADLQCQAGICAFLAVILRAYPRQPGDRHNVCLALTGTLLNAGLDPSSVDGHVTLVASLAGDEEAKQRGSNAASTQQRIHAGGTCWGLPELCRRLAISTVEPDLRLWLGSTNERPEAGLGEPDSNVEILIAPGRLATILDEAEEALLRSGVSIYQRGGGLVRPTRIDQPADGRKHSRVYGSVVLSAVTDHWLREKMARTARWLRPDDKELKPTDPGLPLARHLLSRAGSWRFPVLRGVVETPTLRADGTILQQPGYDPDSQLLFEPGTASFPPVPEHPTKDDAIRALESLDSLLREFPFASPADRSVAVAAILTALVRRSLQTAPLFAFDAPTAGTGKSLLAELVAVLATGRPPAMMSQGKTEEENEKRLGTALMAGDSIIVLDNCERHVEGDFLCSLLTQQVVQMRILGQSQRLHLPTTCMVIATGNNLTLSGDMTRRAVRCRLDAGCEQPDSRQFDFDPRHVAAEGRPALVVAGITILRAYIAAGRPQPLPRIGSFEDWSLIREAIVWLGMTDPAETCRQIRASDPRKADLTELLRRWHACYGQKEMTVAAVAEDFAQRSCCPDRQRLHQLLLELTSRREFNTRSVGRQLSRHVDRIVGDLVLRSRASKQGAIYWTAQPAPVVQPVQLDFGG